MVFSGLFDLFIYCACMHCLSNQDSSLKKAIVLLCLGKEYYGTKSTKRFPKKNLEHNEQELKSFCHVNVTKSHGIRSYYNIIHAKLMPCMVHLYKSYTVNSVSAC